MHDAARGSANKLKYDETLGCFKLSRILPAGHVFPYDFGSVPRTRAADGDALDVLVLGRSDGARLRRSKAIGGLAADRKGRKAVARADGERRDDLLHEARKQTKYLAKALEVLDASRGSAMAKRNALAESIADALGDDHDLAVLCERMAGRPGAQGLVRRVVRRRRELQRKALKDGRRLYRRKARKFGKAIGLRRRLRGR